MRSGLSVLGLGQRDPEDGLGRSRDHGRESGERRELLPIITTVAVACSLVGGMWPSAGV